jgi:hypothetical protein
MEVAAPAMERVGRYQTFIVSSWMNQRRDWWAITDTSVVPVTPVMDGVLQLAPSKLRTASAPLHMTRKFPPDVANIVCDQSPLVCDANSLTAAPAADTSHTVSAVAAKSAVVPLGAW